MECSIHSFLKIAFCFPSVLFVIHLNMPYSNSCYWGFSEDLFVMFGKIQIKMNCTYEDTQVNLQPLQNFD